MLNRENCLYICSQAHRLINGPKFQVSRALRRFLAEVVDGGYVLQGFAFDEGYSKEQLAAIEAYAKRVDDEQQQYLADFGFTRAGTQADDMFGSVSNVYRYDFDLQNASLKQLQHTVKLVAVLTDMLQSYRSNTPGREAGFDDYTYRGLPCSIQSDDALWMVCGHDKRGGSGVLEWCYDEQDARALLAEMKRFPERFIDVKAEPYEHAPGINWAVAQAMGLAQAA